MKRLAILLMLLAALLTAGTAAGETLVPDSWSEAVLTAQTHLTRLGYYEGDITGHYGELTQAAMAAFMADFGLGEGPADESVQAQLAATQYRPLQLGSHGADVKRLQIRLLALGYYGGRVSGNYLAATAEAVRAFQTKVGLSATGNADIRTQEVLFSDQAVGAADRASATPAPAVQEEVVAVPDGEQDLEENTVPFRRRYAYNSRGDAVLQIQQRLADLGYYAGPISGNFLGHTRNAVREFQRQNALSVTGAVDEPTWNALFNDAHVVLPDEPARPTPRPEQPAFHLVVDVTNQIVTAYARDENGEYTVVIREMMCSSGTRENPSDAGDFILSGYHTTWCYFPKWGDYARYWTRINAGIAFHSVIYNTVDTMDLSVRSYNRLGNRASHGCVRLQVADAKWIYDYVTAGTVVTITYQLPADPELKASIIKPELNRRTMLPYATPQPTQEPIYISGARPPLPLTELRRGDSGTAVYWMQRKLAELGYYTGRCTGLYLDGTAAAVQAFQHANGLRASGTATVETLERLYARELAPVGSPTPAAASTPAPTATPEQLATPAPDQAGAPEVTPTPAPATPHPTPRISQ